MYVCVCVCVCVCGVGVGVGVFVCGCTHILYTCPVHMSCTHVLYTCPGCSINVASTMYTQILASFDFGFWFEDYPPNMLICSF